MWGLVVSADVGTTKRKGMPNRRRLRIWEQHKGVCCLCSLPIDGARDRWIIEHIRALELGGEDVDANCAPAHVRCGQIKTKDDNAMAAKAKRVKERHLGLTRSKKPMPFGRGSGLKRKMDGTIVRREK